MAERAGALAWEKSWVWPFFAKRKNFVRIPQRNRPGKREIGEFVDERWKGVVWPGSVEGVDAELPPDVGEARPKVGCG